MSTSESNNKKKINPKIIRQFILTKEMIQELVVNELELSDSDKVSFNFKIVLDNYNDPLDREPGIPIFDSLEVTVK